MEQQNLQPSPESVNQKPLKITKFFSGSKIASTFYSVKMLGSNAMNKKIWMCKNSFDFLQ
jgi:hypothetical protein